MEKQEKCLWKETKERERERERIKRVSVLHLLKKYREL
jgi:hypothetical protein